MLLQFPNNGTKVVPDDFRATISKFNGVEVVVVNKTHYMTYSEWTYNQFCKDASYCDYTDMLPDWIDVKPIHNNESLLAYAYYYISEWVSISDAIKIHENQIEKLRAL